MSLGPEDAKRKCYVLLGEVEGLQSGSGAIVFVSGGSRVSLPPAILPLLSYIDGGPSILEFAAWNGAEKRPWGDDDVTTELLELGVIAVVDPQVPFSPDLGSLLRLVTFRSNGKEKRTDRENVLQDQDSAIAAGFSPEEFITEVLDGIRAKRMGLRWVEARQPARH